MNRHFLVMLCALSLFAACRSVDSPNSSPGTNNIATLIEEQRTRDLRVFFRPKAEIQALEAEQNCLVQVAGRPVSKRKISVGEGVPLQQVVSEFFGKEYDGQVKLISRNIIAQTPRWVHFPEHKLPLHVYPGDLVIIFGRD